MSTWPLPLLHGLGALLGWLTWLASPTYRRRFGENARQAGFAACWVIFRRRIEDVIRLGHVRAISFMNCEVRPERAENF